MKNIKCLLVFSLIQVAVFTVSAANIRVYINPGHGSWGPNCRPQPTIPYPALSSGRPDTLGFYESNTNLWKALALEEKLLAAGGFGANGVVTGNKAGQTQIIVTTMDGGYSDTCDVTVYGYMSDAEAQRIWAYDLRLTSNLDTHTFNFKSVADATDGYLVFLDEAGIEVGRYQLDHVVRGANTITLTDQDIPTPNIRLNWGVELHADAIKETATLVEITDQSTGKYKFYFPQGVAVDNNPESNYFGQIYIAAATSGDNADSNRESQQQAGLFVFDPLLNELNPTNNVGIIPSNVTFITEYSSSELNTKRQQMHRIAVDPVTHKVAFAYYLNSATGAYAMDPSNLAGTATNLVAGAGDITKVNSLCFDKEGTLYVMDNAYYDANEGSTGRIY